VLSELGADLDGAREQVIRLLDEYRREHQTGWRFEPRLIFAAWACGPACGGRAARADGSTRQYSKKQRVRSGHLCLRVGSGSPSFLPGRVPGDPVGWLP
jgi:hypothetical protein